MPVCVPLKVSNNFNFEDVLVSHENIMYYTDEDSESKNNQACY